MYITNYGYTLYHSILWLHNITTNHCISHNIAKSTNNNVSCSEGVVCDTVESTIRMSTQEKMTCSENIAYDSVKQANKDNMKASPTNNTAVYDEVAPRK